MANYRAVLDGLFTDLTVWQDDRGGTYQNSTILPTSGDTIYLNNHIITVDTNIFATKITNGVPETQDDNTPASELIIVGGYLQIDILSTIQILADLYNYHTYFLFWIAGAKSVTILGNCYNYGAAFSHHHTGDNRVHVLTITGNVYQGGTSFFMELGATGSHYSAGLHINGIVDCETANLIRGNNIIYAATCDITGSLSCTGGVLTVNIPNNIIVTGDVFIKNTLCEGIGSVQDGVIINAFLLSSTTTRANIKGYKVYVNGDDAGQKYWYLPKDVVNGLPLEEDVRLGVQYGLEQVFVGELDLPQQATVLKGVDYDSGTKQGTLELPTVDKQDIADVLTEYDVVKKEDIQNFATEQFITELFGE